MFEIHPPTDKRSIAAELERLEVEIGGYFGELSPEELVTPQGEAWSPSGHLRHLVKSVAPVARAMGMPRLVLRLLFGRSREGSRSFEAVVERYHQALEGGVQAGRYGPPSGPDELPPEARRGRTSGARRAPRGDSLSPLCRP